MQILLAFAPFIVFAVIERFVGTSNGLIAGAVVALVLLGRDLLITKHAPKTLDIGTALLLTGSPEFRRTNFVISGAWAVAFAIMILGELVLLYSPNAPRRTV